MAGYRRLSCGEVHGQNCQNCGYGICNLPISKVPPGANGVIFTPWLHGNRCPFEDANAAGMFFNIRVENGKRDMIRAVLEGICYHLRWLLESQMRKVKTSDKIRFVGGGALSPVTCQMSTHLTLKIKRFMSAITECSKSYTKQTLRISGNLIHQKDSC